MFGYLYIDKNHLTQQERRDYAAYHYGLIRQLRSRHGLRAQFLRNRDMLFLIVLLTGLYGLDDNPVYISSPTHPGKKKLAYINEATEYAAAINIILSYNSLEDDWRDDHDYSKRVMKSLVEKEYQKVLRQYPRQALAVAEYTHRLAVLEKSNETNLEAMAGVTGNLMSDLFVWKEDEWETVLRDLGYYIGKFSYLMDAYEDLEEDLKKKDYNPFAALVKDNPEDFETLARLMISSMLHECVRVSERLPLGKNANLINNILHYGVWTRFEKIREKSIKNKEKFYKKEKKKQDTRKKNMAKREKAMIKADAKVEKDKRKKEEKAQKASSKKKKKS